MRVLVRVWEGQTNDLELYTGKLVLPNVTGLASRRVQGLTGWLGGWVKVSTGFACLVAGLVG